MTAQLKDTATTKLLEITATDGQAKARLLAWGSIAQFFHTKIKEQQTYLFENTLVKATPTRYLRADMIPFDITLNSGASVSPKKANIQAPEPNFAKIDALQSMINRRTNLRALIIDYDESISHITLQSGSVAIKRELTIADNTGFKIQATLWGETAETFKPELGKSVMIQNALIKSYQQNVTASVDKIMYCHDDQHGQELEMWYERNGDDGVEQLSAAPKRRLATTDYPLLDDVSTLPSIEDGTCVKIRDKITSLEFTEYDACSICKTGIVQMGSDNFCPKCSKTNVTIAPKVVFTLSLSHFSVPLKLYHDNAPNLLNLKEFTELSTTDQEDIMKSLCKTYTILVMKRQNRLKVIEYVALDFEKEQSSKSRKS